jgi:hypothetical protein
LKKDKPKEKMELLMIIILLVACFFVIVVSGMGAGLFSTKKNNNQQDDSRRLIAAVRIEDDVSAVSDENDTDTLDASSVDRTVNALGTTNSIIDTPISTKKNQATVGVDHTYVIKSSSDGAKSITRKENNDGFTVMNGNRLDILELLKAELKEKFKFVVLLKPSHDWNGNDQVRELLSGFNYSKIGELHFPGGISILNTDHIVKFNNRSNETSGTHVLPTGTKSKCLFIDQGQ